MLALLVLVGGLYHAGAGAVPRDTNYLIRQNASCSASAHFFQRETSPNSLFPDLCYLCFCQNNNTAYCWRRQNRGCESKYYHDLAERNPRVRRSPTSFGEVFVRDAARDFFNKQSPEQCKPFESSFSDGCPPADWCIGCTVCDCDANGRWDCHILSFCSDKNGKKQMKKRRGQSKSRIAKRQSKTSTANASQFTKNITKSPKKITKKRPINANYRKSQVKQSGSVNKYKTNNVKAVKVNKHSSVKMSQPKVHAKKAIPNRKKVPSRSVYIKRNISTTKPISIKSRNEKHLKNTTAELAQIVVKQFMTTIQKVFNNIDRKTNNTLKQENKVSKRQSVTKQYNNSKKSTKKAKQKTKFVAKPISSDNKRDFGKNSIPHPISSSNMHGRIKRQVTIDASTSHKNYVNYSHELNAVNKEDKNLIINGTQTLFVNNSASLVLVIPNNHSNNVIHSTLSKNIMDQDSYVTDNHIYKSYQPSIIQDSTLYNDVNSTKPTVYWTTDRYQYQNKISTNNMEDAIFLTTDHSYLSINTTLFYINGTDSASNLLGENKDYKNNTITVEKKYCDASTQEHLFKDHRCKFRIFLQKIIGRDTDQFITKRTETAAKKSKKYTILSKIKKIIKKIFNKNNNGKFKADLHKKDYDIKETNHKKSKQCKLNKKDKEKLRQKIVELKRGSENILKTIGIIKGLLNILQMNTNRSLRFSNKSYIEDEYIDKLNIIVKNISLSEENIKQLSQDQRTQINYIKDNVQDFIKSIAKFTRTLDDVVKMCVCNINEANKFSDMKVNETNNYINAVLQGRTQNKLEKLKKLILNYNTLQNKFIHQIYDILNTLDTHTNDENYVKVTAQGTHNIERNKMNPIETNAANIIRNIRTLKLLAESINVKKRQKREAIDDEDALEYLLILMEYLLKRQAPTNHSADEGIDILIEAIKRAPDIKLISKKVLQDNKENTFLIRTSTSKTSLNIVQEKSNISSEINKKMINISDQSEDAKDTDEDNIHKIYRTFKSDKYLGTDQKQDDTLSAPNDLSLSRETFFNINDKATTITSDIGYSEIMRYKADDDDDSNTLLYNTSPVSLGKTSVNPVIDYDKIIGTNSESQVKNNRYIDKFLVNAKANVDWIEENFKVTKLPRKVETSSSPNSVTATRTHKHTEGKADATKENVIYYNDKKLDKSSTENIMSKKQFDLLNSLDYVENEAGSKDDSYA